MNGPTPVVVAKKALFLGLRGSRWKLMKVPVTPGELGVMSVNVVVPVGPKFLLLTNAVGVQR